MTSDQDARSPGVFTFNNPYSSPYVYSPYAPPPYFYDEPTMTSVPAGTSLHKGFYDLLISNDSDTLALSLHLGKLPSNRSGWASL